MPAHWLDDDTLWCPPNFYRLKEPTLVVNKNTWRSYAVSYVNWETLTKNRSQAKLKADKFRRARKRTEVGTSPDRDDSPQPPLRKAKSDWVAMQPPSAPRVEHVRGGKSRQRAPLRTFGKEIKRAR
jgi:hypothetical protein